jgi:hypothetical protein
VERLSLYLYEHNVIALREPLYEQSALNFQSPSIGVQTQQAAAARKTQQPAAQK